MRVHLAIADKWNKVPSVYYYYYSGQAMYGVQRTIRFQVPHVVSFSQP